MKDGGANGVLCAQAGTADGLGAFAWHGGICTIYDDNSLAPQGYVLLKGEAKMKRKISILFAGIFLCALLSGCSVQKAPSHAQQTTVTPESTAQHLPEQSEFAPSQADDASDVPDVPEGKTTLVLGGIGLREGPLASLVNNFNAENTKYTVVIDDYAENAQSREQAETVMRTKLFAGDAADLYYFRRDFLSPLPWISAGLLYDLDPLIAARQRRGTLSLVHRIPPPIKALPFILCEGREDMPGFSRRKRIFSYARRRPSQVRAEAPDSDGCGRDRGTDGRPASRCRRPSRA